MLFFRFHHACRKMVKCFTCALGYYCRIFGIIFNRNGGEKNKKTKEDKNSVWIKLSKGCRDDSGSH